MQIIYLQDTKEAGKLIMQVYHFIPPLPVNTQDGVFYYHFIHWTEVE